MNPGGKNPVNYDNCDALSAFGMDYISTCRFYTEYCEAHKDEHPLPLPPIPDNNPYPPIRDYNDCRTIAWQIPSVLRPFSVDELLGMGYGTKLPPHEIPHEPPPPPPPTRIPEPKVETPPPPKKSSRILPMDRNEVRPGYCTTKTGFVEASRGSIDREPNGYAFLVDRNVVGRQIPLLFHNIDQDGVEQSDFDLIGLPPARVLYELNKATPRSDSKWKGHFQRVINGFADHIQNVASGEFSALCGLQQLKSFSGRLKVFVVGMASKTGPDARNKELSWQRADGAAEPILEKLRSLRLKYGIDVFSYGAGTELTTTAEGIEDPNFRQVRVYVMSRGVPDFNAEWKSVGSLAPALDLAGIDLSEECRDETTSGCQSVMKQCPDALPIICNDAYRPEDPERARECQIELENSPSGIPENFADIETFFGSRYRFPLRHSGAPETQFFPTLGGCLAGARAMLREYGPSSPQSLRTWEVIDETAGQATIDPRTEAFCVAGEGGNIPASESTITSTPHGQILRHLEKRVATLYRDQPVSSIMRTDAGGRVISIFPAWRIFHFPKGELKTNTKPRHYREVVQQIVTDIGDAINNQGFYRGCWPFRPSMFTIRLVATDANPVLLSFREDIEDEISKKFGSRIPLSFSYERDDPHLPRGRYVAVQVVPSTERGVAAPDAFQPGTGSSPPSGTPGGDTPHAPGPVDVQTIEE